MKRLTHCVWEDEEGRLHLEVTKLLEGMGMEDTPGNRAVAIRAALEEAPGMKVEEDP